MSADGDHRADEQLAAAGRSFEDHERDLLRELMERVWRDIPPGATVAEAVAEMERAALEDDDARELLLRVRALAESNDGYLRSRFMRPEPPIETAEPRYEFALRGTPQGQEAIELVRLLQRELEERLPDGLSEAEREARIVELLGEDPRLEEMAFRLDQLFGEDPS